MACRSLPPSSDGSGTPDFAFCPPAARALADVDPDSCRRSGRCSRTRTASLVRRHDPLYDSAKKLPPRRSDVRARTEAPMASSSTTSIRPALRDRSRPPCGRTKELPRQKHVRLEEPSERSCIPEARDRIFPFMNRVLPRADSSARRRRAGPQWPRKLVRSHRCDQMNLFLRENEYANSSASGNREGHRARRVPRDGFCAAPRSGIRRALQPEGRTHSDHGRTGIVKQRTPEDQQHGGDPGWGSLALGTIAFIYFIAIQLGVQWEGREQEALKMVRDKGPECSSTSPTRPSRSATRRA